MNKKMKTWSIPVVEELDIRQTAKKDYNPSEHYGYCEIKNTGVCTCGGKIIENEDEVNKFS